MNQQMRYLDFPVEEMELRIRRAKELLAEEDMAGMVVTAAANHFYFTGVRKLANWATFTRTVFVFIPRNKEPVLYVQNFGGPEALSRSAVQDVRTFDEIMGAPVDGVVEIDLQACTPYCVESFWTRQAAEAAGVPYLALETDYSQADGGQLSTRLEAFLEILE